MFTTAVRIEHDVGVPFVSLNALTGHRSCTPEDCGRYLATLPQGPAPVSGIFPAGVAFHPLETGLQAIQLSPYRADPPAHRPLTPGRSRRFPGMLFSQDLSFRILVSHQIREHLLRFPPAARAIQAVRLVTHPDPPVVASTFQRHHLHLVPEQLPAQLGDPRPRRGHVIPDLAGVPPPAVPGPAASCTPPRTPWPHPPRPPAHRRLRDPHPGSPAAYAPHPPMLEPIGRAAGCP